MRPSNKSRSRNKNNNPNRRNVGNAINRVFDSSGPDGRVRGTPSQVIEKYQGLARDAQLSGDRVAAENFQQHAEHYNRVLGEAQRQQAERLQQQAAQHEAHKQQQTQQNASNGSDANQSQRSGHSPIEDQEPVSLDGGPVDTPENASKPQEARRRGPRNPASTGGAAESGDAGSAPDLDTPAE